MAFPRRAFTLIELLVVLAIIALIAGILFPVFASARAAALKTSCLSNFRNAGLGTRLYATDYDDRFVPVSHQPGMNPDPAQDRTWVQILTPYVKSFQTFDCPAARNPLEFGGSYDPDLLPGDYATRFYNASLTSDVGYNAYYLAPTIWTGGRWSSMPRSSSEIPDPSRTLQFVESSNGKGAGSWLVSPPCRYARRGNQWVDTFVPFAASTSVGDAPPRPEIVFSPVMGWDLVVSSGPVAPMTYGGVWPRHRERLNISVVDGGVRSVTIGAVTAGCDVKPAWSGAITQPSSYVWYPEN